MTASQIIKEIQTLPPEEQAEVIRFACRLGAERQLAPRQLTALGGRMANTTDPAEAMLLRDAIIRGFYGGKPNA